MRKLRIESRTKMNLCSSDEEFYSYIEDIVHHPEVVRMKRYPHHGNTSCYQHSLNVSYYNYRICKFLGWDARSAARAGMLHDLFLYDWHMHTRRTGNPFHGLTHPWEALHNARKHFAVSPKERDMIVKHMWPLTVVPPSFRETFVICLVDKYCTSWETTEPWRRRLLKVRYPVLTKLMKKVFGSHYQYRDYQLSSVKAAEGSDFVSLRKRPSDKWRKGSGRRVRRWK